MTKSWWQIYMDANEEFHRPITRDELLIDRIVQHIAYKTLEKEMEEKEYITEESALRVRIN